MQTSMLHKKKKSFAEKPTPLQLAPTRTATLPPPIPLHA